MCIFKRKVTNRYTHRELYVKCGRCPACLQEKATRMSYRLKDTSAKTVYFLTLTYKNDFLPYIRKSDLDFSSNDGIVPVYRDGFVRRFRSKDHKGQRITSKSFVSSPCTVIDHVRFNIINSFVGDKLSKGIDFLRHPVRHPITDAVSVCYYKDAQDFVKRFKINVERKLNKSCTNESNKFFVCSEYGGKTHRAHFHVLLFSDNLSLSDVKRTLIASWPYADFRKLRNYCEIAVDASSYVASYVNCADSISSLLAYSPFRPKHSFSQGIGMDNPEFSPAKVLQALRRGSLQYPVKFLKDGVSCTANVPIPDYVLNRYFPYVKGLTSLSTDTIRYILERPAFFSAYSLRYLGYKDEVRLRNNTYFGTLSPDKSLDYSKSVLVRQSRDNVQRLKHCYNRFSADFLHYTPEDYIRDYITCLRTISRDKFQYFYVHIMKDLNVPQVQCYDNIIDLVDGSVSNESLFKCIDTDTQVITDPNQFDLNIINDIKNRQYFDLYSKYHYVSNDLMSLQGHDV